ncbi:MAG: T9SS type A sorting domain-containing protein [Chlorobi bacterium]|nr:T9SS type A sorting domain-containing protein [Chlorobiota bacterium]
MKAKLVLIFIAFLSVSATAQNIAPFNLQATVNQSNGKVDLSWQHLETTSNLNEDFSDGIADNWIAVQGTWSVADNLLKATRNDENRSTTIYYMGEYANTSIEAKFRKPSGDRCGLGIYFAADPSSLDGVGLGAWNSGYQFYFCYGDTTNGISAKWNLRKFSGGSASFIQGFTETPDINPELGDWNILKIVFADGNMDVYINNVLQGTFFDNAYSYGKVGINVYDFFGGGRAEVDYVKINKVKKGYTFGKVIQPEIRNVYSATDEGIYCDCAEPVVIGTEVAPTPNTSEPYVYGGEKNLAALERFNIYKNNVLLNFTTANTFSETLSETGTNVYEIRAKYSDGESDGIAATLIYTGNQNHYVPSWSGNPSNPMILFVTSAISNNASLEPNDEIGVFDGNKCVGSAVVTHLITRMAPQKILLDDFTENNALSFKFWNADSALESTGIETKVLMGDGEFHDNTSAVINLGSAESFEKSIELTYPTGGEEFSIGDTISIAWNSVLVQNVFIEYTVDEGATWTDIATSYDASLGSYRWGIPDSPSNQCFIRIFDSFDLTISDRNIAPFTILDPPVRVQYPNGGEELKKNTTVNIVWDFNGVTTISIDLSTDAGNSWTSVATGVDATTRQYVWDIPDLVSEECLIKITDEASGFSDVSDAVFNIYDPSSADEEENGIPFEFKLSQNYPNPFNPSTSIRYQLPKEGFVSLAIYDALGKKVASLVNQNQRMGFYTVNWNAVNQTSGIYFLRLNITNGSGLLFRDVKKLILMK